MAPTIAQLDQRHAETAEILDALVELAGAEATSGDPAADWYTTSRAVIAAVVLTTPAEDVEPALIALVAHAALRLRDGAR